MVKLPTYLRTHRKRGGLAQKELAALLGCQSGASVCQYERQAAQPSLETAFACQVIFGVPAHELFPGIFEKVEQQIIERAALVSKELRQTDIHPLTKLKRKLLQGIVARHGARHATSV